MDLDENIPTIEASDDSPVKAVNKQEFPQDKPKQEENPYEEKKAGRYPDLP
jgi:hypothetical protein